MVSRRQFCSQANRAGPRGFLTSAASPAKVGASPVLLQHGGAEPPGLCSDTGENPTCLSAVNNSRWLGKSSAELSQEFSMGAGLPTGSGAGGIFIPSRTFFCSSQYGGHY